MGATETRAPYKFLTDDMTWSYSRVKCFRDCPYRWFLKYIRLFKDEDLFFSSYGSLVHAILERYYTKGLSRREMVTEFLVGMERNVPKSAPNDKLYNSYLKSGVEYFKSFKPFDGEILGVEKEIRFKIGPYKAVGVIDLLAKKDGDIYIIDNKSRLLKPRSTRRQPTKSDVELDEYLRQLYIYAVAVEAEYGVKPKYLCFNCFRGPTFIQEPFVEEKYKEAQKWFTDSVREIERTGDFGRTLDWFACNNICGVHDDCEYYWAYLK